MSPRAKLGGQNPGAPPPPPPQQVPEVNVRDLNIVKADVHIHGPTPGCRGCRVGLGDKGANGHHPAACRERMRGLLAQTEAGVRRLEGTEARLTRAVMQGSDRQQPGIGSGHADTEVQGSAGGGQPTRGARGTLDPLKTLVQILLLKKGPSMSRHVLISRGAGIQQSQPAGTHLSEVVLKR